MAVLGSILLVVAYNMGEWREIPELWKHGWTDRIVWVWTFALTVLADLTVAVEAGMIIAALMFIRRVTATTTVARVTHDYVRRGRRHILQDKDIPGYVTILRIHGPFLFGATDKLTTQAEHITDFARIVVLRLRNMTALDGTGLRAIQDFSDALAATGRTLLLCGALPQPASLMNQAEFHHHVGAENILPHVDGALKRAAEIWATRGPGSHRRRLLLRSRLDRPGSATSRVRVPRSRRRPREAGREDAGPASWSETATRWDSASRPGSIGRTIELRFRTSDGLRRHSCPDYCSPRS
jgi:SulP family sulfate permease